MSDLPDPQEFLERQQRLALRTLTAVDARLDEAASEAGIDMIERLATDPAGLRRELGGKRFLRLAARIAAQAWLMANDRRNRAVCELARAMLADRRDDPAGLAAELASRAEFLAERLPHRGLDEDTEEVARVALRGCLDALDKVEQWLR